ncbi:MAG: SGNH/GDSL hydrolase family protein [Actinobacteria bacterium]|nr:SGNH/GDSL hydrolase family protein [Actinomycetota bacterium]
MQSQLAKNDNLTVNSLGFRGEEISQAKNKNTFRIAILGGSTVLNREVIFEKNAARLLEKKLRKDFPSKKIEVINAGKDFYTSQHSAIQLMFKILDLKPDLIIVWHGVNDLWQSCLSEGVVSHGVYKSDYSHTYGIIANIIFNYFKPQPIIQFKLLTLDFFLKSAKDNLYSDITNKFKKQYLASSAQNLINKKNTVSVKEFPSIEAYDRNLRYIIELVKDRQIPLIIGNQASLLKERNSLEEAKVIISPLCMKEGKYYDLDSLRFGLNLFNSRTRQIAQDTDTYFIDIDASIPKNLNYFFDMVHLTEDGNQKVADILYDSIVSNSLISN